MTRDPASSLDATSRNADGAAEQDRPLAVVALGGHAFTRSDEPCTIEIHQRNAAEISTVLMVLVDRGYNLVITHGNGPQVGHLMRQADLTREHGIPTMPLDVLVADTEGWLGYILQQALINELRRRRTRRFVVTVVTQVLVDKDDPAFAKPTKPVGRFMSADEAEQYSKDLGWHVLEDAGRGWRRCVPSPQPRQVVQWRMIRDSVLQGHIVIAAGGGGIPVIKDTNNDFQGVEAVIDKDLTSSVLAASIGAELMIVLTDVPHVYRDYGTSEQSPLGAITMQEAEQLIATNQFATGSMGPKVQAIHAFLKAGGRRGLITDPATLAKALEGRGGTHFVGRL